MAAPYTLAPGTILQIIHLRRRLKEYKTKDNFTFIEFGSGGGQLSSVLLEEGLFGICMDISAEACDVNRTLNSKYVDRGQVRILNEDFFSYHTEERFDIVFSSHVIEHLSDETLNKFFEKSKILLKPDGRIICIVPSGMKYWGVEDETAGHYRRFEKEDVIRLAKEHQLLMGEVTGLTFPLSNWLLWLSNLLVKKYDGWKLDLSKADQTELSSSGGAKKVPFKTHFPWFFRYFINEITLSPFDFLQRLFSSPQRSMILFFSLHLPNNYTYRRTEVGSRLSIAFKRRLTGETHKQET